MDRRAGMLRPCRSGVGSRARVPPSYLRGPARVDESPASPQVEGDRLGALTVALPGIPLSAAGGIFTNDRRAAGAELACRTHRRRVCISAQQQVARPSERCPLHARSLGQARARGLRSHYLASALARSRDLSGSPSRTTSVPRVSLRLLELPPLIVGR